MSPHVRQPRLRRVARSPPRSPDDVRWSEHRAISFRFYLADPAGPFPDEAFPDRPRAQPAAARELFEEEFRIVVRHAEDRGDLARRAPVVPAEEGEDRFLRRVEDLRDDIGVDLPQDVLEHLPRLPPVDARGRMLPRDLERRESRDLVPLAFLAVRAERGFGTAVVESRFERVRVQSGFARDLQLHAAAVDRPAIEAPRLPQRAQVPLTGVAALPFGRLHGDACG